MRIGFFIGALLLGLGACADAGQRADNLAAAQAASADVNMLGASVHDGLDALHIGLPCTVGSSVRMGDLNAERNALAADIALCHQLHLLAIGKSGNNALKRRQI